MSAAAEKLDDWLNKEAVTEDDITAFPLTALAATLDREESGETVPPLWHWLYFLPVAPHGRGRRRRSSAARRLPAAGAAAAPHVGRRPADLSCAARTWASARTRTSTIANIEDKTGRRAVSCSSRCSTRSKRTAS